MKKTIRRNCFWCRPWRDMSATIDQCYFYSEGECPCHEDCEKFITKAEADEIIEWFVDVRPWTEETL